MDGILKERKDIEEKKRYWRKKNVLEYGQHPKCTRV